MVTMPVSSNGYGYVSITVADTGFVAVAVTLWLCYLASDLERNK